MGHPLPTSPPPPRCIPVVPIDTLIINQIPFVLFARVYLLFYIDDIFLSVIKYFFQINNIFKMSDDDINALLDSDDDDDLESPCLPLPQSSQSTTVDSLAPKVENIPPEAKHEVPQTNDEQDEVGKTDHCHDEDVPRISLPLRNVNLNDEMLTDFVDFNNEDNDNEEGEEEDQPYLTDLKIEPEAHVSYPPVNQELLSIFQSCALDAAVLEGLDQTRLVEVAPNLALEGISVLSTAEEEKIRSTLDDREQQEGVKAGLGHKKKSADRFVLYKNNSRSRGV